MALALSGALTVSAVSADGTMRTVRGDVVAVDPSVTPPVIVIKSQTPEHDELIVGAIVDKQTVIMRGQQAASLGELKEGEPVTLRYIKTADGLVARLIQAQ